MNRLMMFFYCFSVTSVSAHPPINTGEQIAAAQKLAETAINQGELQRAKILLVNAYNRDHTQVAQLRALHLFYRRHERGDHSALNELIQLTERALYLIEPRDVPDAVKLLKSAYKERDSKNDRSHLTQRVSELLRVDTKALTSQELDPHIDSLESILRDPHLMSVPQESTSQIRERHTTLSHHRQLLNLSRELKRYTGLLQNTADLDSPRARARSGMISNTLNLIYSEDIEHAPREMKTFIEEQVNAGELAVKAYVKHYSQAYYQEAATLYNNFVSQYNEAVQQNMNFQAVINRGSRQINTLREIAMKIHREVNRRQAYGLIERAQGYIQTALKLQSVAYNKWAAQRCLEVRLSLNNEVSLSDAEAINIFRTGQLSAIEVRFISPEVSSIYHQLIQEILGELPASKAIEIQRELMIGQKRKLSSF